MSVRTFGAQRAAGVRVEEQDGDKSITPGALGFAGFAGLFEKGPVGQLGVVVSRELFDAIYGGVINDGIATDCARDYYSLAAGAGGLCVVRVTDGNELQAELPLYARNANASVPIGKIKAANGGRWGGKAKQISGTMTSIAALAATTLQLPAGMSTLYKLDELKGGYIELDAVSNKRYPVISSSASGLLTVGADQTMLVDHGGGANLRFYVSLENESKEIAVRIGDGEENPAAEFSVEVFVDGESVKKFGNLHTDPLNARYWADVINNEASNYYIVAQDTFVGTHVPATRPANVFKNVLSATALTVTLELARLTITAPVSNGNPTLTIGTTTDVDVEQTITITMTSATAGTAVSDKFGALGTVTFATLFDSHNAAGGAAKNKWVPPFTIAAGGTPLVATDVLTIVFRPLKAGLLTGGILYPRKQATSTLRYRIVSNDHKTITIAGGSDMVADGVVATDDALVEYPQALSLGRDGHSAIADSDYTNKAWDTSISPFNRMKGQGLGLVKLATPGVTSTAVQKAGIAYASAKNHQYRTEIPLSVDTEDAALNYVNSTIGRSEYSKVFFPTYGYVPHPDPAAAREGKLKAISTVGMQLGREARIVADYQGYHKAQAGVSATLPRLLKIPTGDRELDQERLNPAGINVICKKRGNFVLWGDRTVHLDSNWKFAHQREQMSYYEHVLEEEFDFIIFEINDPISDRQAETALMAFFLPEYTKRAIRGKDFKDAAIIKVDSELNTNLTRSNGDKIAFVSLRLADVVERFIIRIGKQGVFEQVS